MAGHRLEEDFPPYTPFLTHRSVLLLQKVSEIKANNKRAPELPIPKPLHPLLQSI